MQSLFHAEIFISHNHFRGDSDKVSWFTFVHHFLGSFSFSSLLNSSQDPLPFHKIWGGRWVKVPHILLMQQFSMHLCHSSITWSVFHLIANTVHIHCSILKHLFCISVLFLPFCTCHILVPPHRTWWNYVTVYDIAQIFSAVLKSWQVGLTRGLTTLPKVSRSL